MHALALLVLLLDVHRPAASPVVIEQLETDATTDAQVWVLDDGTVVVWLDERE